MGIDLKQALVFVPQDSQWVQKVFIGGLLLFFPTFVYVFPGIRRMIFDPINYYLVALFFMFAITVFLAVSGYFFKAVHNRIVHDKERLPSWKHFTNYVYVGFKSYVGGLIFSAPFILLQLALFSFAPMSFSKEMIPFILTSGIIHIVYTSFYVMLALNFAKDFKVTSFLNIKKAYALIKENIVNYVILVLYCLLVGLLNLIVSSILAEAQIFALLLPFVNFYIYLVYTDLFAQFASTNKDVEYNEKECLI